MKLFQEGDRSRAVCQHCEKVVGTTFVRRDVPFRDNAEAVARDILVGACDCCGQTVSIPAQSTPAISKVRKEKAESIEARLPAIYLDVLDYAVHAIDPLASTEFRRVLLTYFLHKAARRARAVTTLRSLHAKALTAFPENRGETRRRLSMKIAPRLNREFRSLADDSSLSTTDILKSVVYDIRGQVLEKPNPELMEELRTLSAIAL